MPDLWFWIQVSNLLIMDISVQNPKLDTSVDDHKSDTSV